MEVYLRTYKEKVVKGELLKYKSLCSKILTSISER